MNHKFTAFLQFIFGSSILLCGCSNYQRYFSVGQQFSPYGEDEIKMIEFSFIKFESDSFVFGVVGVIEDYIFDNNYYFTQYAYDVYVNDSLIEPITLNGNYTNIIQISSDLNFIGHISITFKVTDEFTTKFNPLFVRSKRSFTPISSGGIDMIYELVFQKL